MTNRTRLDSLQQGEKFKFSDQGYVWRHLGFDSETGMQAYELADMASEERYADGGCYVTPVPDTAKSELTPYDTGERLEPKLWIRPEVTTFSPVYHTPDAFGKVDFDNDEGRTVLTVWVERTEFGGYAMYVLEHGGGELDVIHKGTAETLKRLDEEEDDAD